MVAIINLIQVILVCVIVIIWNQALLWCQMVFFEGMAFFSGKALKPAIKINTCICQLCSVFSNNLQYKDRVKVKHLSAKWFHLPIGRNF